MGYIVRRIAGMDYKNMLKTVGSVHQISGKNRVGLFFDVIRCGLKYGAGYKDYELFEFYNMTPAQRATYVTRTVNNSVVARCNNRDYYHCFNDKTEFNTLFKDFIRTTDDSLKFEIRKRVGLILQNPDNQLVASIVEEAIAFGPVSYTHLNMKKNLKMILGSVLISSLMLTPLALSLIHI